MAGQANSLISHGSLVGTIKTSNVATNSLVGRLNVDNTITGRMDTSSLTGALDTDNAITSQSGSISTDDQMIGVLNTNNTIAGGVGTAYNPAYALVDEAAAQIVLYINNTDYKFYAELKDKNGSHIVNSNIIDLPLESMVVNGSYDSTNKEIVLTLNNGNTLRFSVADLVSGLVSTTDLSTVLLNYVEFTDYANGTNAGVVKTSSSYATETSDGVLRAQNKTYAQYESLSNNAFIGKGTLDNAITGKELTNKTYVDNADKVFEDDLFNSGYVTSEGTSMSLDVKTGKPEIELKGNTIQASIPTPDNPQSINVVSGRQDINVVGKNLFDKNNAGNLTGYNLSGTTGGVSSNTERNTSYYIEISSNTQYTLSGATFASKCFYDSSKTFIRSVGANTFTTPNNAKYMRFAYNNTLDYTNIQLEKNNEATTYEPYKGQSYEINLGKNLFDKNNTQNIVKQSNSSYTILSNGIRVITSRDSGYCDIVIVLGLVSELQGKTQTISYNVAKGGSGNNSIRTTMWTLKSDYSTSRSLFNNTNNGYQQVTYTVPNATENNVYLGLLLYSNNGSTTSLTGDYVDYTDIQIEEGSQATSYSAYKTPIELCKIGNYKDRIYKENGTWYLHKEIGKVVLNGSERWTSGAYGTNSWDLNNIIDTTFNTNELQVMSSVFKGVAHKDRATSGNNIIYSIANKNIEIRNTTLTTQAQVQNATNGTPIYYILATPIITEITDSELISQLESIELLEGLNNVLMSSSGDLPGIIKIKAFSNTTAGSITRLEKIVEFLGDSIGDIGTLLDEIQGEVI